MRVLCIIPQLPHPADNGQKVGVLNVLDSFRLLGASLQVLSFRREGEASTTGFADVPFRVVNHNLRNSPIGAAVAVFARQAYTLRKYNDSRMQAAVASTVRQFRPDIVHIETVHMAWYLACARAAGAKRCGVRAHNVEHLIWQRVSHDSRSLALRLFAAAQRGPVFRQEIALLSQADVVFPVSEEDAAIIRRHSSVKNVVMPSIVQLPQAAPSPPAVGANVLFVGSLDWFPNEDGIQWFVNEVWWRVVERDRSARLRIVGRKASAVTQALAADPTISVHSDVPSVADFYAQAKVVVVPIRIGGGIRMKILEAMAYSRPVVSTSVGAEGLGFKDAESLLIADRPSEMAEAIVRLLADPALAEKVAAAGRRDLLSRFSLEHCANTLKIGYGL